jgi:hypothetical protein
MADTTATRTIAWFTTLEDVRAAQLALERNGVDAVHISVQGVDTVPNRRDVDRRTFRWLTRRAVVGAVVGVVVGALIGLGLAALLGYAGSDAIGFILAGSIFGFAPGFFYAVGTRLPAESETFDTFADDSPGEVWIAVSGTPEVRDRASAVLDELGPARIQTVP